MSGSLSKPLGSGSVYFQIKPTYRIKLLFRLAQMYHTSLMHASKAISMTANDPSQVVHMTLNFDNMHYSNIQQSKAPQLSFPSRGHNLYSLGKVSKSRNHP